MPRDDGSREVRGGDADFPRAAREEPEGNDGEEHDGDERDRGREPTHPPAKEDDTGADDSHRAQTPGYDGRGPRQPMQEFEVLRRDRQKRLQEKHDENDAER